VDLVGPVDVPELPGGGVELRQRQVVGDAVAAASYIAVSTASVPARVVERAVETTVLAVAYEVRVTGERGTRELSLVAPVVARPG
jgi:hypothetical protein